MDSNFQYAGTVNLVVASLCRSIAWDGSARRSGVTAIAGTGREFWHDGNRPPRRQNAACQQCLDRSDARL
jgi:hypothetical protein